MSKKCSECGKFMHLTDRMPMDDEFDSELFIAAGYDEDDYNPDNDNHIRFHYVQDQWECSSCEGTEWYTEGKRYYYNPATNNYDGNAPLTLEQQKQKRIEDAKEQARKAGQMVMFGDEIE